jgi:hypothetical protein
MSSKTDVREKIIPRQKEGAGKDIDHTVVTADENDARKLFMIARNRLVNVNEWHHYAKPISSVFRLTDGEGHEVDRTAEAGDYFKIDLPGPGPAEGKGYDWVRVEAIEDKSNADGPAEHIAIRVRPAPDPTMKQGENVAHFFDDRSTSSFVLMRNGKEVTAAVYSRNEIPNTETSSIGDKVRNAVVGATAILGFSNVQWKNLVKGVLESGARQ